MKYAVGSPIRASLRLSGALSVYAVALLVALPAFAGNATQANGPSAEPQPQSSDASPAAAADPTSSSDTSASVPLAEVLVRGSRLPTSLATMPQSVQIVSSTQLAQQMAVTTDVQTMLANTVPGLSQSSYSTGETLLSLRGRKPVILIDGVPVTSTLNDTGRELSMITPEDISEVEVIRGSSALYGQSEGAGFINFLTKGGEPGPANFRTEVGSGISLADPSADSLIPYFSQSAAGTVNDFDYRAGATFTTIRSLYDADGDRLPPPVGAAIQNSQTASAFAKGGYNFSDQRLEASFYYDKEESWDRYNEINGNILTGQPAVAIPEPAAPGEVPQLNDETLLNLVYAKSSLFGSSTSLRVQTYYYKSFSIFQYTLKRFTLLPPGPDQNGQSENDTHKYGARADFNTTLSFLPFSGTLLWGVDYMHDRTTAPLVDGRAFGIPQALSSIAGFAQLQFKPIDPLTLTVGVRREHDSLDVSNFYSLFTLVNVTGGELPYDATPINAGFVFNLTPALDLFGGYSQGFNIQQTSQTFRSWPVNINLTVDKPPPNVVDSFEGGLRWHGNGLTASATYFYNKSSDAIAYSYNPAFPADPSSSFTPDRVWGTEIEGLYRWADKWEAGLSYAWMEGKEQTKGVWYPLQDRYIPPWTIDAHLQYAFAPGSYVRVQTLYSGSRNKFPNAAPNVFYEGQYHSFSLTDISLKYDLSNIHSYRIPGDITVSVSNAFNKLYFTAFSQGYNTNANYIRGPGAMLNIRYGVSY